MDDFTGAYDAALAAWPIPVAALDIPTRFGTTRVYRAGPDDGRPAVLLPGGGLTAASRYANVATLAESGSRVHAVDIICDKGRGVPSATPVAKREDLVEWLTATMRGLGLARADLIGHSYGGWIAAHHAVHAPDTVDRLILLDPTSVFCGFRLGYLLRSVPALLGAKAGMRSLLNWETGGRTTGLWADLACTRSGTKGPKLVLPKRLTEAERESLTAVVIRAGSGRAQRIPDRYATVTLERASHHTIPAEDAESVNEALRDAVSARSSASRRASDPDPTRD